MAGQNTAVQFSFSGGEYSPGLRNRRDWGKRDSGAAEMANVFVSPTGGAVKRGGFRLIDRALSDTKPVRLIPFQFSETQTYILELCDGEMRVFVGGDNPGKILSANGSEYRCRTPYTAEQAQQARCAQLADAMFFVHPDVSPQKLTRYAHANWEWGQMTTAQRLPSPARLEFFDKHSDGHNGFEYAVTCYRIVNGAVEESIGYPTLRSDPYSGPFMGSANPNIDSCLNWQDTYIGTWGSDPAFPHVPDAMNLRNLLDGNPNNPAYLNSKVFRIYQLYDQANNADIYLYYGIRKMGYEMNFHPDSGVAPDDVLWCLYDIHNKMQRWYIWRLYPGQYYGYDSWFMRDQAIVIINNGLVVDGSTVTTVKTAIDNYAADVNKRLSYKTTNKIKWEGVAGAVGYYVYRRTIGSKDKNFYRIGSTTTTNFLDDIEQTVPGTQAPIIGQLYFSSPGNYPSVVTFKDQRLVYGGTYNKPQTIFGSEVGHYTNFTINPTDPSSGYEYEMASDGKNIIRNLTPLDGMLVHTATGEWKFESSISTSSVKCSQQSHIGSADIPSIIVNETAIFVTSSRKRIQAMSYQYQRDGYKGPDLLYYASHLTAGKEIVGIAYQQEPDNVIWAVLDDGTAITCTYIPDEEFIAWTRQKTDGKILSIASMRGKNNEIWAVVERMDGHGEKHRYIERLEPHMPWSDEPNVVNDALYVDSALYVDKGEDDQPATNISGLEHLEGRSVNVLADGSVYIGRTVSGGKIALDTPARRVRIGLPYDAAITTLDLELTGQQTLRGGNRQPWRITAELYLCRELVYTVNGGNPVEAILNKGEVMGGVPSPFTGDVTLEAKTADAERASIRMYSGSPVPFGVLSVLANIDRGGL